MALRVTGLSYPKVAEQLGVSVGTAFNDCKAARSRIIELTRESAEEVRSTELDRLDRALHAIENAILAGDTRAIDTMLKLSERRAKLLGLDAPEKHDIQAGVATPEAAAALVRQAFGEHGAQKSDAADGQ